MPEGHIGTLKVIFVHTRKWIFFFPVFIFNHVITNTWRKCEIVKYIYMRNYSSSLQIILRSSSTDQMISILALGHLWHHTKTRLLKSNMSLTCCLLKENYEIESFCGLLRVWFNDTFKKSVMKPVISYLWKYITP